MTMPFNLMALFCEDIREEKNGVFTLIGIMPDNVNVEISEVPKDGEKNAELSVPLLGKICAYVRINFDLDTVFRIVKLRLVGPGGEINDLGTLDAATFENAKEKAKERGAISAGVITRVVLGGLNLSKPGPLKLEAEIDGETYLAGAITISLATRGKES